MIDESMDKEQMAQPPQPWEFRSKPSWQRLIIMLGGVTVNFILAAVIYIFMAFTYGAKDVDAKSVEGGYEIRSSVLKEIGLQNGDKVIAINNYKIVNISDIKRYIIEAKTMTIDRDGTTKIIEFPIDFLGQLTASKPKGLIDLRNPFIITDFQQGSINAAVDLQVGDIMATINQQPARFMDEITPMLETLKGQTAVFTFERNGVLLSRELQVSNEGELGVIVTSSMRDYASAGFFKIVTKEYGFGESIGAGLNRFSSEMASYWMQLKLIFSPSTGAYKGVGGFKAIFDIFPSTWNWEGFWTITALLSIMLGVLNLLPIPALDGGHVMFLLYEMVSGRKPSDKFMEYAQTVGFLLLISLVLFANGNDIFKAIFD
jgi:regulator of sigma E protease